MKSVGIAIITHNAKHHLRKCLPPLFHSSLKPRVLVVNSSSNDGTVELAEELGAETLVIPRAEFNHGATRERARKHLGTDIVVMITPDAYATSEVVLERLIAPLLNEEAAVSYARQIPHVGADFFESFHRHFNYPEDSQLRSIESAQEHGVATIFCSNSFAAYSNEALDAVGGFSHVLLGEDTLAVAKLLDTGHKIAYVADAIVYHSHRYTLFQEFQRSFDTGLMRQDYAPIINRFGKDTTRGKTYVKTLLKQVPPKLLPYAILQTLAKWLGYKIGTKSTGASLRWKRLLSSQDFYWATEASADTEKTLSADAPVS